MKRKNIILVCYNKFKYFKVNKFKDIKEHESSVSNDQFIISPQTFKMYIHVCKFKHR